MITLCGTCGQIRCVCNNGGVPAIPCTHDAHYLEEETMHIRCALCSTILLRALTDEERAMRMRRRTRKQKSPCLIGR